MKSNTIIPPEKSIAHINSQNWNKANHILLHKALTEFAHELIVLPKQQKKENDWGFYTIAPKSNKENVEYSFKAKLLSLDHWYIDYNSLRKFKNGLYDQLDVINFLIEFKNELEFPEHILPVYIEEVISTLYGRAQILNRDNSISTLVDADYQTIEGSTTGHPTFLANNGRIGFDVDDYYKYAPESQNDITLLWIAVKREKTIFSAIENLSYDQLIVQELSDATRKKFNDIINTLQLNLEEYYFMPVHPWQWYKKMNPTFSPEIAHQNIIFLGEAEDSYRAQQAIRTFFNTSKPHNFYVKTALSILNMGFMRGLSPYYMQSTPAINKWVDDLVRQDEYLQKKGFIIIKEVAAMGYKSDYYERALQNNSTPYTKMLASLWRESPISMLEDKQRLMTMAALLHIDNDGKALLPELIRKSKLSVEKWVDQYLEVYLLPIIHCFFEHDLVFMPHGENLIMILENYIPVKIIMKDIAEEIAVLNPDKKLPGDTSRIGINVPDDFKLTFIFTDVFDCFLRYVSSILYEHCNYSDEKFWEQVANKINDYQHERPEMINKFRKYNLFTSEFQRCCLNRLQIKNNKQMVNLEDPINSLQFKGTLINPIAKYHKMSI